MPEFPPYDEASMMSQLVKGDEKAFTGIFKHYYPLLMSFVTKITKTEHSAEEIVQEVFFRLWKKREEFRQTNYIGSWLYRVAANIAFDFLKRAALQNKLFSYYQGNTEIYHNINSDLEAKEKHAEVYNAIRNMPDQQRLVYKLNREEGLSYQEIADKLKISPNTVRNHIAKALQVIRKALNNTAHFLFSFL